MKKKAIKILLTYISLMFFSKESFSQKASPQDSLIITHYAANVIYTTDIQTFIKDNVPYFLVKVSTANAPYFKKKYKLQIERQINSNWFIIKYLYSLIKKEKLIENLFLSNDSRKLSPIFFNNKLLNRNAEYTFLIRIKDSSMFIKDMQGYTNKIHVQSSYHSVLLIKTTLAFLLDTIVKNENVLSVDVRLNHPQEESVINDYDNSVNAISLFFSAYPQINGDGLTASVKENLFDTSDIDFKGRYISSEVSAQNITTHATTMATLIGGGGNSFQSAKGIAWGCSLSSSDFTNLLPDNDEVYRKYNISVQNNSYGVGIENFYGIDAAAYDQSAIDNPFLLQVFSAGNSGNLTSGDGTYKNITGFANITGSFKQAKNILTAGSVDSFYIVPELSSKGPAYDGRVKPELVAYGNDGSSGSAAITSGAALAVQSGYAFAHHDSLPQNVFVKAVLVNSADDIYNAGPDFFSGYGNVNVYNAVKDAVSDHYFSGSIKHDETQNFLIHIPANIANVKFSLVWNDPPAPANAFTALVNDIDISLEDASHSLWLPWVLNSNPNSSDLLNSAARKRDSLNTIEQITIANPDEGDYIIHLKGYDISTASQAFFLVYRFDTLNHFKFISPVSNSHIIAGSNAIFRWNSTYTGVTGKLEYSVDKGNTWKLINNTIQLSKNYYRWAAPDTNVIVLARMTIGNDIYLSDTFDISSQIYPGIGFNCKDSVLIYWKKQAGIKAYQLYTLGNKYLEAFSITNDTSLVIRNPVSAFVAVASLIDSSREGLKSYTYNYTTQGVGCYISNFLADPDGNNALLKLFLGTTFNVKSVQFQKLISGVWNTIAETNPVMAININYSAPLLQGINVYRAIVTFNNGSILISDAASVYYFKSQDYIIVPNPVQHQNSFSILSNNISSNTIIVFDITGRKILREKITQQHQNISTARLSKGLYLIVIFSDTGSMVYKTKVVVN